MSSVLRLSLEVVFIAHSTANNNNNNKSQLPKEPLTLFSVFLVALYNRVLDLPLAFRFFLKIVLDFRYFLLPILTFLTF